MWVCVCLCTDTRSHDRRAFGNGSHSRFYWMTNVPVIFHDYNIFNILFGRFTLQFGVRTACCLCNLNGPSGHRRERHCSTWNSNTPKLINSIDIQSTRICDVDERSKNKFDINANKSGRKYYGITKLNLSVCAVRRFYSFLRPFSRSLARPSLLHIAYNLLLTFCHISFVSCFLNCDFHVTSQSVDMGKQANNGAKRNATLKSELAHGMERTRRRQKK